MIRIRTRFDQICNHIKAGCLGKAGRGMKSWRQRGQREASFRQTCLLDPGQDRLLPHLSSSWVPIVGHPCHFSSGYPADTWVLGTPSQTFPLRPVPQACLIFFKSSRITGALPIPWLPSGSWTPSLC